MNLLMLTGPLFMLQVYDRVLASGSMGTLMSLGLFAAGLYVFHGVFDVLRTRLALRTADQVESTWRRDLFRLDIESRFSRSLPHDPARESEVLRTFVASPALTSLLDLPWVPLYVAVVFIIHPTLGWLAVGGVVVVTLLLVVGESVSRSGTVRLADAGSARQVLVDSARRAAETIKALGMTGRLAGRYLDVSGDLAAAQRLQVDRMSTVTSVGKTVRFLLQSGVLAVGAFLVLRGEMSAGAMIAASIVTSRALAPVEQVVAHWRPIAAARLAAGRVQRLLVTGGDPDPSPRVKLPPPMRSLRVQSLGLRVHDTGQPLVEAASFELFAGDGLGILGPSGAGKTTLLRGIAGVWPAHFGVVRLDESELRHFDEDARGAHIGYLAQQVDLLEGTIAENIARGDPHATSEAVLSAASQASAHELIAALSDGYDTKVGRDGLTLSAGQRQRIGLARALYGDPFLVLLDEPSSNLDAQGDAGLAVALGAVRARGGIVVVISHRPSTVGTLNKLLYLDRGTVRAFGDRDEVLGSGLVRPG